MRRSRLAVLTACSLLVLACLAGTASAARVIVLERDGHARVVNNPLISAVQAAPAPRPSGGDPNAVAVAARRSTPKPEQVTVINRLAALQRQHAISAAEHREYLNEFNAALTDEKHLSAPRADELAAVTESLHDIAARDEMTASRLPVLFLTLERNIQYWKSGPLLSYGQRVQFAGSELVWEYYPGQGIQLQVLGTFGEADADYTAGPADYGKLQSVLAEMIPLAVRRGGGLAWEYYFSFDGGSPPWVSAMAEGTGIEALTRAYEATGNRHYLQIAHEALPLLETAPPTGVGETTARGRRYLQYSFAPQTDIINAFLQTLIGLDDYAKVSGDATAAKLFAEGNAEAESEVPSYNTGAWSLYQPGLEDDLSYHELVTGFLQELCQRTAAPVYCTTATDFQNDLRTPPALTQLTTSGPAGHSFSFRFRLSKESKVGFVLTRGGTTDVYTSGDFGYGVDTFTVPELDAGTYDVRLAATDLAGNVGRITGTLTVG